MPTELDPHDGIRAFASTISRQPLGLAAHRPEAWGQPTRCFENAMRKAELSGGAARFGWMFHYRLVAKIPGPGYLIASHHAVWHAPDGHLVDVTPFHDDPKHHPLTPGDGILFLVDDAARPVVSGNLVGPLPLRFFPLSDDNRLAEHIERLRDQEDRKCRDIYADRFEPA